MIKYYFTQEEIDKCKSFSESVDTSFYARRSQFNEEKRKKDSFVGKLGEIAVYNYLKSKINNITRIENYLYANANGFKEVGKKIWKEEEL